MWWIHIAEPYCLLQCVCFRLIFVSAQAFVINTIIVLANGYDLLSCLHLCYNTKIKPLKIEPYAIPTHRNWADSVRIKHVRMKHDCWNSTFNQLTLVCPVMYPVLARIMVFCFWRAARQEKKGGGTAHRDRQRCGMCVWGLLGHSWLHKIESNKSAQLSVPSTDFITGKVPLALCNIVWLCMHGCNFVLKCSGQD